MAVTVTYNNEELPELLGPFTLQESYTAIGFSCTFIVKASSSSALSSTCSDLEAKMREPFEALSINFNGSAEYTFSHDENTCLNSQGAFERVNSEYNTETSRVYSFSFSAELPADKSGFNFRRRGDFTITESSPGQRFVRFNLEYTASPSPSKKSSEENFDEQAVVYATGVLSSLFSGVAFDQGVIVKDTDQEQKITRGSIEYSEIFEPESAAGNDDPALTGVVVTYNVQRGQRVGVSSAFVMIPQTRVTMRYSAQVVKASFTTNDEVNAHYVSFVKPHMIARAIVNLNLENTENASNVAIVESDDYSFDPVTYSFVGTMTFVSPLTTSDIVSLEESISEEFVPGILLQKLWDGQESSYSGYQMGSELTVVRNIIVSQIGSKPDVPPVIENEDLILLSRTRVGSEEIMASNTEVGEQRISLFIEAFTEVYKKAVIIENQPIAIPE